MYVACIQVKPLPGCQIDPDEYMGAAVRCYIPASTEEASLEMLQKSLEANRLELVETDFLVDRDAVEWEHPDDPTADELSREAEGSGAVIYGEFRAWCDDAE